MDRLHRLHQDYAVAFLGYLARRDESGLRAAYELGRGAVSDPVGLLNVVRVHHEVLVGVLRTARTPEEVQDIGDAAAAFLIDALTSFQMTQRGYMEKAVNREAHWDGPGVAHRDRP
nr:phosphatase RsbU N-terminal domain-containing protein [uncultured Actinoplanes sp.]